MKWHIGLFIAVLAAWLLWSGFTYQKLLTGIIISVMVTAIGVVVFRERGFNVWYFILYIPYYIYHEILAHLDVMYRILTGRINPGIVSVPSQLETKFGTAALANSITMTPGTLTLEARKGRLYVHCLNTREGKSISGKFQGFLKRIWG